MYDFEGTESGVRTWRDMTTGDSGTYASGNKKILPYISIRLQNSIVAYDKYIFVFGYNYPAGSSPMGNFNGIYYMIVETEEWWMTSMLGPSKI